MNDWLKLQCENCLGPMELRRDDYGALLAKCSHCEIDYLIEKPQMQTHYPVHVSPLLYGSSSTYITSSYYQEQLRELKRDA